VTKHILSAISVKVFAAEQHEGPEIGPAALAKGKKVQHETVRVSKSGQRIVVALSVAAIEGADGRVEGISVIARDITDKKRAQEHVHFLLREMSHRSKNLLAVIQAIAAQTARSAGTIEQFETRLMQRLHGIAASHDLFIEENWQWANLVDLMLRQLTPFIQPGPRLRLEGPRLLITPEAAQNIGFALHELTTNAVKYGALSGPSGSVSITWQLCGVGADQRLRLTWRENGGPRVKPQSHAGFGSTVINKLVVQSLNAELATEFAPDGFWWELNVPAAQVVVPGPGSSTP
jgi:two-component sensor histidine kinase